MEHHVPMLIFRDRLRERSVWAKKNLGLTQKDQAELIGVSRERFKGWFRPGREPSIDLIVKASKILETHPNYLLGEDDNPVHPKSRPSELTGRVEELLEKLSTTES